MPKYVLEFQKKGLVKYTSHLDMLRLFKRAFKITGIPLEFSKGYNPHPKMALLSRFRWDSLLRRSI